MNYAPGSHVLAFGKSLHSGQTGTVVADYGNYILVKAFNETYSGAHRNSIGPGKYFQVDVRHIKLTTKDSNGKTTNT